MKFRPIVRLMLSANFFGGDFLGAPRLRCAPLLLAFLPMLGFAVQPIHHTRLDDRLEVYWVLDHTLPMVDIQVDFDAGSRFDPPRRSGMSGATAQMLSKGVQGENATERSQAKRRLPPLDENALGQAWADIGAIFSASSSDDRLSVRLRSLVKPEILDKALELGSREIGTPSFDSAIWSSERAKTISFIQESETQPAPVASKLFRQQVFGAHPYGQSVSVESIKSIEVRDLKRFHQQFFSPCKARVSVVGDVEAADVERIARALLARLPEPRSCAALAALPTLPEVQALAQSKTVAKPFVSTQAHVLMGQVGIARGDARYFPLTVGNYILGGGGFVSRLTDQVREKRGLSYSVYSYFNPEIQAGPFTIGLQTKKDQAQQALDVVKEVLTDFVDNGPTPEELQAAKDNLIGGFALRFDNNKKLLDNVANIAWYGLPLDYLQTWTQAVQAVTVESIHEAFKSVLDPKRMVTVIVGAPS